MHDIKLFLTHHIRKIGMAPEQSVQAAFGARKDALTPKLARLPFGVPSFKYFQLHARVGIEFADELGSIDSPAGGISSGQ